MQIHQDQTSPPEETVMTYMAWMHTEMWAYHMRRWPRSWYTKHVDYSELYYGGLR